MTKDKIKLMARITKLENALALYADSDWWVYWEGTERYKAMWYFSLCKKPEDTELYHPANAARELLGMPLLYRDSTYREVE